MSLPPPDIEHVKNVCKIGQGEACCRYLTMGSGGWSCEKLTELAAVINRRVAVDAFISRGINCEGRGDR